jgi:hypothetical protein
MEKKELFSLLNNDMALNIWDPNIILSTITCVGLSFALRKFYFQYSSSLSGKQHIGNVLPILTIIVFLIILVVKSSLALSLGLVGALSIVRFRTPIKEPEELVYLFLAIAIGLGLGAGHITITVVITFLIMLSIKFWLSPSSKKNKSEQTLVLNWRKENVLYENVETIVKSHTHATELVRLDLNSETKTVIFTVLWNDSTTIDIFSKNLSKLDNDMSISFFKPTSNI